MNKCAELSITDQRLVHPVPVERDAMGRPLGLGQLQIVRPHDELAAGDPHHSRRRSNGARRVAEQAQEKNDKHGHDLVPVGMVMK